MRYIVPHEGMEFEVSDPWLEMAGAKGYSPSTCSYRASSSNEWPTTLVQLSDVEAPRRNPGVAGLDEKRTVCILRAFCGDITLPPLEIDEPPGSRRFRFRVRDGFHRFYLSVAVGVKMRPVSVRPYFDIRAQ